MQTPNDQPRFNVTVLCELASYIAMTLTLFLVIAKGLLVALLSGLLAYSLIQVTAPLLGNRVQGKIGRYIVAALLGVIVVGTIVTLSWDLISFFQDHPGRIEGLTKKLADVSNSSQEHVPAWLWPYLPHNAEEIRGLVFKSLRDNAVVAKTVSTQVGMVLVHWIAGLIIGALIALKTYTSEEVNARAPLTAALMARCRNLADAFRIIVFAQVRISAINATITAIFLFGILPFCGVNLPFSKTMVVLAFILGMMPVVGNTTSNTILIIIGLSHSFPVALAAFGFMFSIHKLEYFLNAKIMGSSTQSKVWEMLLAMLAMEAIFGLPGLVAAPVFYAYLKIELKSKNLI